MLKPANEVQKYDYILYGENIRGLVTDVTELDGLVRVSFYDNKDTFQFSPKDTVLVVNNLEQEV